MVTEMQRSAQDELQRRKDMRKQIEKVAIAYEGPSLAELFERTNMESPAPADLDALKTYLAAHPAAIALLGNLANQVEVQLIGKFKHIYVQHLTLSHYCEKMRIELGQAEATPIEKGLIDHIVLCWLRLHICELEYERNTKGVTVVQAAYWEKKLSTTQKRYLRAIETLTRIRKLNINLQINVAQNQIVTGA